MACNLSDVLLQHQMAWKSPVQGVLPTCHQHISAIDKIGPAITLARVNSTFRLKRVWYETQCHVVVGRTSDRPMQLCMLALDSLAGPFFETSFRIDGSLWRTFSHEDTAIDSPGNYCTHPYQLPHAGPLWVQPVSSLYKDRCGSERTYSIARVWRVPL